MNLTIQRVGLAHDAQEEPPRSCCPGSTVQTRAGLSPSNTASHSNRDMCFPNTAQHTVSGVERTQPLGPQSHVENRAETSKAREDMPVRCPDQSGLDDGGHGVQAAPQGPAPPGYQMRWSRASATIATYRRSVSASRMEGPWGIAIGGPCNLRNVSAGTALSCRVLASWGQPRQSMTA